MVGFSEQVLDVPENAGSAHIYIKRTGDLSKESSVRCHTSMDVSAVAGKDYEAYDEIVVFAPEEDFKVIEIKIIDDTKAEKEKETFKVELDQPATACQVDAKMKEMLVRIIDDDGDSGKNWLVMLGYNSDKCDAVMQEWREQFVDAVYPPSRDWAPFCLHILSVVWKIFAAFIPPVRLCGGWMAFVVALVFIGFVTILVGELATFFGCVIGCPPGITAIVFVALGTSLPDTFASKTAALQDDDADNSVGNVTGSNCVNVFLGIGLPWMIASIKWAISGPNAEWTRRYAHDYPDYAESAAFVVPAGDLGTSVAVFCSCATFCLITLWLRRRFFGGELGGPTVIKWVTFVVYIGLWALYILISSLKIEGKI